MVTVIVINNSGNQQEKRINTFNSLNLNKLYHNKCENIISCLHLFDVSKDKCVGIFGATGGNAGNENSYELPPPIDTILLFGNIIIVAFDNVSENIDSDNIFENSVISLDKQEWYTYYEKLFGGFESLSNSENDSNSSSDLYDALEKTKSGYALDGFVVNDNEIFYENSDENDSEYEDSEYEDSECTGSDSNSDYEDSNSDSDC